MTETDMPYLKAISTPLLAATLITGSAATAQDGGDCDLNILDPFNPKWVEQYGVACNNARRVSTTPPAGLDPENGIPFERLKTMPVAGQGPGPDGAHCRGPDEEARPGHRPRGGGRRAARAPRRQAGRGPGDTNGRAGDYPGSPGRAPAHPPSPFSSRASTWLSSSSLSAS